ncbi:MAG: hypothetical protein ACRCSP_06030 [Rhodoglobus sp.]
MENSRDTKRALWAGVTALGFIVVTVGLQVVGLLLPLFRTLIIYGPERLGSFYAWEYILFSWLKMIPIGVGFFFSLWIIAPITGGLRLANVIFRAILALALGSALVALVSASLTVLSFLTGINLLGVSVSRYETGLEFLPGAIFARVITEGAGSFVSYLPVGVLAGILLWLWCQKRSLRTVSPAAEEVTDETQGSQS